ncbi:MAG: TonB-dependent receptor, partial [Deltaproteobacteria bacterium]|nr:TonB-dependent receptor [Deltaproteobacteria bacterium]
LDHRDVSLRVVYEMGDLLDVSLYGDYIDRDYGRPGVEPPKYTEDFWVEGLQVYGERDASRLDRGGDKDGHLVLEIKSEPLSWLGLGVRGDYTQMRNYNYARWVTGFPPFVPYAAPGNVTWTTNEVLGIEGNVTIEPVEDAKLLLGAEHEAYDWENIRINVNGSGDKIRNTKLETEKDLYTTGLFAEAQYRPCKYVKGLAGMRYESHSEFGHAYLPRVGIIFNPFKNTAIKASHGRHFRAPTPNALFWPEDPFAKGNPDLDPEKGWHTDVTFEQSLFDDKVFLTASYFHWDLDNKILWGPDSAGVWMPENLKRYKANGIEVGAKVGPFYNLTLNLNYTYQHAKERSKAFSKQQYAFGPIAADFHSHWVDRRATYTPKSLFKGSLTYESPWGMTATAVFRYVGNRVFYNTETDKAYPKTKTVRY